MFKLNLSPIAGNSDTQISASVNVLTINGIEYDFSVIPENGSADGSEPFIGEVTNVNGTYNATVRYEYDMKAAELIQSTDANDYIVELTTGEHTSPIVQKAIEVNDNV